MAEGQTGDQVEGDGGDADAERQRAEDAEPEEDSTELQEKNCDVHPMPYPWARISATAAVLSGLPTTTTMSSAASSKSGAGLANT